MHKILLLSLALLVVAGCQSYEPAPPVAGLGTSNANTVYKPLPGQSYTAPGGKAAPNRSYAQGQTPTYSYSQNRSSAGSIPKPPPNTGRTLPPVAGQAGWALRVPARQWRWIVIHHSDTAQGSAAAFARYHRQVNHWTDLGYHFVIDNGNGQTDGLVEVGARWTKQKEGAHAGVLQYNDFGIGICLVGNFNNTHPTPAQVRSLAHLTAYLMHKYRIPADHIVGHRDVKKTDCPGRYIDLATIRRQAVVYAAAGGAAALAAK